jgi:hypothetical protein
VLRSGRQSGTPGLAREQYCRKKRGKAEELHCTRCCEKESRRRIQVETPAQPVIPHGKTTVLQHALNVSQHILCATQQIPRMPNHCSGLRKSIPAPKIWLNRKMASFSPPTVTTRSTTLLTADPLLFLGDGAAITNELRLLCFVAASTFFPAFSRNSDLTAASLLPLPVLLLLLLLFVIANCFEADDTHSNSSVGWRRLQYTGSSHTVPPCTIGTFRSFDAGSYFLPHKAYQFNCL